MFQLDEPSKAVDIGIETRRMNIEMHQPFETFVSQFAGDSDSI